MKPIFFASLLALTSPLLAQSPALAALLQGRMADANALLAHPTDAREHLLLCRIDYAQSFIDPAASECQIAASLNPNDSDTQLWLGRALGQKAAHSSSFSAFGIARKVRDAFERAVQLNPRSVEATSDLAEFYVAAPGIVGGGKDKAQKLAASVAATLPAVSHRILARIAEKNGDLATAESEYKAAIAAGKSPDTYIDLAHFYQSHNRPDDAVAFVQQALAADQKHGPALVDAAGILTDANRNPKLAESALRNYIASKDQSDTAPVFKAHLALARLLARQGDSAGAQPEIQAAFRLAPQYPPARKAAGQ